LREIRVNRNATIDVQPIDDANSCVVIDDFLSDPQSLVDFASTNAGGLELQDVGYPGVLCDVPGSWTRDILHFLRSRLSRQFSFFKGDIRTSTYLSMATRQPDELSPLQRLCHSDPRERQDRRNYAGLVYLFDNQDLGGTGFYRWKERELIEQARVHARRMPDRHPDGQPSFQFALAPEAVDGCEKMTA